MPSFLFPQLSSRHLSSLSVQKEEHTLKKTGRPALKTFEEFQKDCQDGYYGDGYGQVKMCLPLKTLMKTLEYFPEHQEELLEMFNYKMENLINPMLWE